MIGLQWRNEQALSKYPFDHGTDCEISAYLADLRVFAPGGDETTYVSEVRVSGGVATFVFATASAVLATASCNSLGGTVSLLSAGGEIVGVLVTNETILAPLFAYGDRTLSYAPAQTRLCPWCVVPVPQVGVSSLTVGGLTYAPTAVLRARRGVEFTVEYGAGVTNVRVDAVGGTAARDKLCEEASAGLPTKVLRTINHVSPDADGCWQLYACPTTSQNTQELLRIRPSGNSLMIHLVEQT